MRHFKELRYKIISFSIGTVGKFEREKKRRDKFAQLMEKKLIKRNREMEVSGINTFNSIHYSLHS